MLLSKKSNVCLQNVVEWQYKVPATFQLCTHTIHMLFLCVHVYIWVSVCVFFQARSVNVKSQIGSTYQNISSLEITGTAAASHLTSHISDPVLFLFYHWCIKQLEEVADAIIHLSLLPSGPILPSSLHTVTTLLRPAQKGNFSATLYTHAPTAIMNTHTTKEQVRKSYTFFKKNNHE